MDAFAVSVGISQITLPFIPSRQGRG
jgi:hypothetical protein